MKLVKIGSNMTEMQSANSATRILVSYSTPVAAYVVGQGYLVTTTKYSPTTARHINKWVGDMPRTLVPQAQIDVLANA